MDDSRVPDLEGMNEQQAQRFLTDMFTNLSAEAEYEIRHEDFVMEMPQSGERIRGRENMREFQRSFADNSNPPTIHLRRVTVRDGLWILEGVNDYGEGQGLYRRGHLRAEGRQDLARHPLLRRALRRAKMAGRSGRTDGFLM